ncbi:peroxidase family protein [Nocardioides terrigena]|uniref:peroxidase family protein n=1 Tax=Nocardioides terrigena TaxID=424797 RepID=UPI001902B067|nr:peroxidase family protein [Nocardioides terrigena]
MGAVLAIPASFILPVTLAPAADAAAAEVGQGFTVSPSDLAYILKQIKIAEKHVADTTSSTGACGALRSQLASPLVSFGLRTVDGSCNNLVAGKERSGAADEEFPRLAAPVFKPAEDAPATFGGGSSSYAQKSGNVFDTQPRTVSNLIVDQTSTNPAAIAAAGFPVRTQGNPGVVPCTTDPDPLADPPIAAVPTDCTPSFETLFIPNVTTDVGLSPPYNSLFTLFGQFFDHGVDQTVKGGGTVFVPLKDDDPLVAGKDHRFGTADDLSPSLRFMVLTRGKNQPGTDGVMGTEDDVQDADNTDSPWVDQSQTYTSHASHQAFLREYTTNAAGRPVPTGKMLGGVLAADAVAGVDSGMATWASTKEQAATLLGLQLTDKDVLNVPMLAVDAYGNFLPGPLRGLPQYVTDSGLVEGDTASPVPVPGDVKYFDTPFLTDIAHSAEPTTAALAVGPDSNTTAGEQLDVTSPAGSYDDELLDAHFIAGDGRVNENIGLTAIHQVFHSEHDRLVDDIKNTLATDTTASGIAALAEWKSTAGADGWNGSRLFQAARFVTEMEYQHLVFEEFARKVQPGINPFEPFAFTQTDLNPAVRAEFAHAVYRFGHSMLTETISRRNADGSDNDISLLDGFLNPPAYTDGGSAGTLNAAQAAGSIVMGMTDQTGNELDEFVTETLRNNLLGLPLDLASINMTRARSEGVPPLNVFRRDVFARTNDGQLKPYTSWVDFGENLKHPESLVNFVAAYGQHPTILRDVDGPDQILVDDPGTAVDESADNNGPATLKSRRAAATRLANPVLGDTETPTDAAAFMNSTDAWANSGSRSITGLDDVDLWVGGLAETTTPFGGLLGTTFNYVFENQMTDLQNGDRLYYLARTPGMNLRAQLEGNSFAEMIERNTDGTNTLKADVFATSDCKFQLANLAGTPAGFTQFGNTVANDPTTECDETALLIRQPNGTIQYRARNTVDPPGINGQSVYNGTNNVDRIYGGNDNDTFWGNLGNDIIEGGGGADVALGGEGSDIITDLAGDDVPKGGPGNDAIDAGPGLDIVMGGNGKDFTNGGANANETFGGAGDDFIMLGQSLDAAFGDSGNDWEEGGDQPDLMQGDSGNLFFLDDSQAPGSDVLIGQGGDDDYDMEGGDDIGVAGPGIEKVAAASGYDWQIAGSPGQGDPIAQDLDLALPIAPLDILQVGVRDKFNEAEALSGGVLDDILRGDDVVPSAVGGGGFIGCDALDQDGLDRISGLDDLVPPLATPRTAVVAASASGDCPILSGTNVWGDGNILLGGAGNDLIEGRGADDIIDGDAYVNVRLSVRTNPADASTEIGTTDLMENAYLTGSATTLQEAVFNGTVDPGNIVLVREVLSSTGASDDTALFSGPRADYDVTFGPTSITVAHTRGAATDGTDTLRGIEKLQFSDTTITLLTPAAPAAPTAVAGNASATVTFTAPADNGGPAPTSFTIVATPATVTAATPVVTVTGIAAAGSRVVAGLVNGTAYTFQVQAVNEFGPGALSAASNTVTPTAPVATTAPGAPTIGTAVAGNASATVNWTAPANTGGSAITEYRVQVRVGTTLIRTVTGIAPTATSTVVTALTNGTGYNFRVRAVNAVGVGALSAASNTVTPTGPAPATAPGAPTIGTAVAGNASATVSWTAPANTGGSAITEYRVQVRVGTTLIRTVTGIAPTATSTVVSALTNGTGYNFRVRAVNAVGVGALSAASNTVTPTGPAPATAPAAPTIATAVAGVAGGAITATANWAAPANTGGSAITGYRVFALRMSAAGAVLQTTQSAVLASTARTLAMTLPQTGNYRFQVVAINAIGTSPRSARSNLVAGR